jgi:hypothetical protein
MTSEQKGNAALLAEDDIFPHKSLTIDGKKVICRLRTEAHPLYTMAAVLPVGISLRAPGPTLIASVPYTILVKMNELPISACSTASLFHKQEHQYNKGNDLALFTAIASNIPSRTHDCIASTIQAFSCIAETSVRSLLEYKTTDFPTYQLLTQVFGLPPPHAPPAYEQTGCFACFTNIVIPNDGDGGGDGGGGCLSTLVAAFRDTSAVPLWSGLGLLRVTTLPLSSLPCFACGRVQSSPVFLRLQEAELHLNLCNASPLPRIGDNPLSDPRLACCASCVAAFHHNNPTGSSGGDDDDEDVSARLRYLFTPLSKSSSIVVFEHRLHPDWKAFYNGSSHFPPDTRDTTVVCRQTPPSYFIVPYDVDLCCYEVF